LSQLRDPDALPGTPLVPSICGYRDLAKLLQELKQQGYQACVVEGKNPETGRPRRSIVVARGNIPASQAFSIGNLGAGLQLDFLKKEKCAVMGWVNERHGEERELSFLVWSSTSGFPHTVCEDYYPECSFKVTPESISFWADD
jgi:hypothetical protein